MKSTRGQLTFNFALKVPNEKAAEVQAVIQTHARFMREHHSLEGGDKIHLVDYHVVRADELNNPADPSQGTTGNVLFCINEIYVAPEGLQRHFEAAATWPEFGQFLETLQTFGQVLVSGGEIIETL